MYIYIYIYAWTFVSDVFIYFVFYVRDVCCWLAISASKC